ncbi:MAG: hypothetical protein LBB89_07375 [Treponema sp.]|jgi:hypothetical protein|nr:hypothetical protein [Treponema sp.]
MAGFEADIKKEEFLMKKPVLVALIIALVCGMAMIGCSSDSGSSGGGGGYKIPGLLGKEDVPALPTGIVEITTKELGAKAYFDAAAATVSLIIAANKEAFDELFLENGDTDYANYATWLAGQTGDKDITSASWGLPINDADGEDGDGDFVAGKLSEQLVSGADEDTTPAGTIKTVSSEMKWTSNKKLSELTAARAANDYEQFTNKFEKKISFGYGDVTVSSINYKVAANITVKVDGGSKKTLVQKAGTDADNRYNEESNALKQISVAVSVYTEKTVDSEQVPDKGASFVFQYSIDSSFGSRAADGLGGSNYTDVTGTYTYKGSEAVTMAQKFEDLFSGLADNPNVKLTW